jgi:outer membrane protein assembly factor BamA
MTCRVILVIFIFGYSAALHGGPIEITGNRHFSDKEMLNLIDFSQANDALGAEITKLYRKEGYFGASVRGISILPDGAKEIELQEGKPSKVARVEIQVSPQDTKVILETLMSELTGKISSEANLNDFAGKCIELMSENGMPFASGHWREFEFDEEGNLSLSYRILSGPQSHVAGARFSGIRRTRRESLRRRLEYAPGELFSETKAAASDKSIDRMPYIDIAGRFEIESFADGESIYVLHQIIERPSTRFDGAGGFVSTKGSESLVGRLDLEFGDILGTGRAFGFNWNRKDKWSNELRVNYLEPYLLNSSIDLRLEASQTDKDTSFIKIVGKAGLLHAFKSGLAGGVWFGIDRTTPEKSTETIQSTGQFVTGVFDFDRADEAANPRAGYGISSVINYKFRRNESYDSSRQDYSGKIVSAGTELRYFIGISKRIALALKANAWGIVAEDGRVPLDEMRFLGGIEDLRGYADGRFPAYRFAMLSVEPRILTGAGSRIYAFTDLAEIKSSQYGSSNYRFYPDYGLGVVAPSALGQFRIEIGWGKSGFPSEGVLNFGLVGRF